MVDRRVFLLAALALLAAGAGAAMPAVVLVVAGDSPVERVTLEEARRLYLGMPLRIEGRLLRPVHNGSDPVVAEIFMQRVMFMSGQAYEDQLRLGAERHGGGPPRVFVEKAELVAALLRDPMALTYMARDLAAAIPGLRVVGEL